MATATWSTTATIDSLMILENPDSNYGSGDRIGAVVFIVGGSKAILERAILNFDVSPFPGAAADIVSAKLVLDLTSNNGVGQLVNFDRCTKPDGWDEAQVTWNDRLTATPWDTAGGDLTATDEVTVIVPSSLGSFDVLGFKTLTEDAINNRSDILSLIVKMNNEADSGSSRDLVFYSSEGTGAKPTLEITYAPPDAGRRSVPRSPFGETARSASPAAPGRAFAGARKAQPSKPQRRRPR